MKQDKARQQYISISSIIHDTSLQAMGLKIEKADLAPTYLAFLNGIKQPRLSLDFKSV